MSTATQSAPTNAPTEEITAEREALFAEALQKIVTNYSYEDASFCHGYEAEISEHHNNRRVVGNFERVKPTLLALIRDGEVGQILATLDLEEAYDEIDIIVEDPIYKEITRILSSLYPYNEEAVVTNAIEECLVHASSHRLGELFKLPGTGAQHLANFREWITPRIVAKAGSASRGILTPDLIDEVVFDHSEYQDYVDREISAAKVELEQQLITNVLEHLATTNGEMATIVGEILEMRRNPTLSECTTQLLAPLLATVEHPTDDVVVAQLSSCDPNRVDSTNFGWYLKMGKCLAEVGGLIGQGKVPTGVDRSQMEAVVVAAHSQLVAARA